MVSALRLYVYFLSAFATVALGDKARTKEKALQTLIIDTFTRLCVLLPSVMMNTTILTSSDL